MSRRSSAVIAAVFCLSLFFFSHSYSKKETIPKEEASCYECHDVIKSLRAGSRHASLPCARCHGNLAEHLKDHEKLPSTNLELTLCGRCHPSQYETYVS